VPADEERLSFVAGGIFDQGEVQPFEALRTSTLAREGSPSTPSTHNALKVWSFSWLAPDGN